MWNNRLLVESTIARLPCLGQVGNSQVPILGMGFVTALLCPFLALWANRNESRLYAFIPFTGQGRTLSSVWPL